jgi:uncharacterized protein (TIGR03086 family)
MDGDVDLRVLDRSTLAVIDGVLAAAGVADLDRPTPCAGWTLADLLRHQISENQGFATAARDGAAPDWNLGAESTDLFADYRASVDAFLDAFSPGDVLERPMTIREFGTMPGHLAATMHLIDSVVPGWDFARSLDVAYEPDPAAVRACFPLSEGIPDDDLTRAEGQSFAHVVAAPAGASDLERLVALLGRDPAWQP